MIPVLLEQLEALAAMAPKQAPQPQRNEYRGAAQAFDLDRWIVDRGLKVALEKPWNGAGRRMVLATCPFNTDHSDGSAVITQSANGKIGFKCHHNSCEGKHWRDVRELLEPETSRGGGGFSENGHRQTEFGDSLPFIQGNYRQLREVSGDCVEALTSANDPPVLFVRGGEVARVRADEKDRPIIEGVTEAMLNGQMTRTANFFQITAKGSRFPSPPPRAAVLDILAMGTWPFPALEGVVEVPTLRPDGSILATPGYDPLTRLVYQPNPILKVPAIPELPTTGDVEEAKATVADILFDFPFIDQASRANAWATLLTPLIRHAIRGRTPCGLCDAPKAGTGKGLIASIVSIIATGREAAVFSAPGDDDEWRKQITSALLAGTTVIIIDNIEGRLDSPSLSRALTAPIWTDRRMKTHEQVHLPNNATWLATGNNIALGGDMPRRCYLIRIDAQLPKPWERKACGFRHPRLEEYVTENRGELVAALLTLARSWYAAGKPAAAVPAFGGFEAWSETIGSILAFVGITGFLGNLPMLHSYLDQDTPVWEAFFESWHEVIRTVPVTVSKLTDYLKASHDFQDVLPEYLKGDFAELVASRKSNFNQRLGKALSSRKDTVYSNGLQLVRAADEPHKKIAQWAVGPVGFAGSDDDFSLDSEAAAGSGGEQIPLYPRTEKFENPSVGGNASTPRNSPQSCLEGGENAGNSPQNRPGDSFDAYSYDRAVPWGPCDCETPSHFGPEESQVRCETCGCRTWCRKCAGCVGCRFFKTDTEPDQE